MFGLRPTKGLSSIDGMVPLSHTQDMGGPLARLEVNLALETFLRRVDNPRQVVDPPPYRRSQVFRGPLHLLVDVDGIRT